VTHPFGHAWFLKKEAARVSGRRADFTVVAEVASPSLLFGDRFRLWFRNDDSKFSADGKGSTANLG
jgi:hypothetical protein